MSFFEALQAFGIVAVAVLAFLVNLIVELTKNAAVIKKIPTSLYATIISVVLSGAAYFVAIGVIKVPFMWYEFIISFIIGFPVAYVAMYGWEKLNELWSRFKK